MDGTADGARLRHVAGEAFNLGQHVLPRLRGASRLRLAGVPHSRDVKGLGVLLAAALVVVADDVLVNVLLVVDDVRLFPVPPHGQNEQHEHCRKRRARCSARRPGCVCRECHHSSNHRCGRSFLSGELGDSIWICEPTGSASPHWFCRVRWRVWANEALFFFQVVYLEATYQVSPHQLAALKVCACVCVWSVCVCLGTQPHSGKSHQQRTEH